MKYFLTFLFVITFFVSAFSQNYKQVKIFINDKSDYPALRAAGLQIDNAIIGKDNSLTVFISNEEFSKLQMTSFSYEVLINDWKDYYSKQAELTESEKLSFIQNSKNDFGVEGFGYGSMGCLLYTSNVLMNFCHSFFIANFLIID